MHRKTIAPRAWVYQSRGLGHARAGVPGEDVVCIREGPDLLFYGLADGRSGAQFGALGGRASLEALECFIRRYTVPALEALPFPDELPFRLMAQVRSTLLALAKERQAPFEDFASTLLAIAIDPATGRYLLLHLGDGCALGVGQKEISLLSGPENGLTRQHTWLTTGRYAIPHFRVTFGVAWEGKRLALISDGARGLCRGSNLTSRGRQLLLSGTGEALGEYLKGRPEEDDATCILLDFP